MAIGRSSCIKLRRATLEVVKRAFEAAGVEFIDANNGGADKAHAGHHLCLVHIETRDLLCNVFIATSLRRGRHEALAL